MSRPPSNLSARIRRLEAAKARADKLPARQSLSFKPMLELLSVSRPTLTEWCDLPGFEKSGCFVRGGNGIEWEFKARRTVDWLLRHFRKEAEDGRAKTGEFAKKAGSDKIFEDAESPSELRQFYELSRSIRRDKIEDGQHTRTDDNLALHSEFAELVKSEVMSIVTRFDPNGNEDPALRERISEISRETLIRIYEGGVDINRKFHENLQREGFV